MPRRRLGGPLPRVVLDDAQRLGVALAGGDDVQVHRLELADRFDDALVVLGLDVVMLEESEGVQPVGQLGHLGAAAALLQRGHLATSRPSRRKGCAYHPPHEWPAHQY